MDGVTAKSKRKANTSRSDSSKLKAKTVQKTVKYACQPKKGRKKSAKVKKEADNSDEASQDLEGEPISKKKKLDVDCMDSTETDLLNSENKDKKWSMCRWKDDEYLSAAEDITIPVARNMIKLFDKENTIPFIARYRGHLTGHLSPDKLRRIKATYDYIHLLHKEASKLIEQVPPNELTPELRSDIESAQTLETLEFIGSHFKKDSKRSLAHRAKELGLEDPAKLILEGKHMISLDSFVKPKVPGLEDVNKVKLGIQHIIADIISKNKNVHELLEVIYSSDRVLVKSKFKSGMSDEEKTASKYKPYGDFSRSLSSVRPHQTLAINRGESEKELTVKIDIPDALWQPLRKFCSKTWLTGSNHELRRLLVTASVDDAIKRLLEPLAVRRIRARLNSEAESEALGVFGVNLRQLLMTPPCSGQVVLGIDPGFGHGCKVAVVSRTGEILDHDKFFLHQTKQATHKLKELVLEYGCNIIALGNGTACRQTETLLSDCIRRGVFEPLQVSYTIINEQGVSIYSCSPAAAEEFPGWDPKIVGAVSIARRLQNPLSELVKVEPKHLGVGMYQHDVKEKKLESTLEDIVSECVSFVGVDINSASFHLLKRVAGLNASKAQEIIKYRTEICSFKCREDLKKVKGIKDVTFQQCAGFIRVIPATARCNHRMCPKAFNPLDETAIHPESYDVALKIMSRLGLILANLGYEDFVRDVKKQRRVVTLEALAKECNCSTLEVDVILDSLERTKDFDLRSLSAGPVFRRGVIRLEDLVPGQVLEGVVRNVVNFGVFVDVGVGQDGLIHTSQMGNNTVHLNNRVEVEVRSTGLEPPRIELKLLNVLE